jgi:hypothetical protein
MVELEYNYAIQEVSEWESQIVELETQADMADADE